MPFPREETLPFSMHLRVQLKGMFNSTENENLNMFGVFLFPRMRVTKVMALSTQETMSLFYYSLIDQHSGSR